MSDADDLRRVLDCLARAETAVSEALDWVPDICVDLSDRLATIELDIASARSQAGRGFVS